MSNSGSGGASTSNGGSGGTMVVSGKDEDRRMGSAVGARVDGWPKGE